MHILTWGDEKAGLETIYCLDHLYGSGRRPFRMVDKKRDVWIHFDSKNETKHFLLLSSIANGFLSVDIEDFSANVTRYKSVLQKELEFPRALERANSAFAPYADCIEE